MRFQSVILYLILDNAINTLNGKEILPINCSISAGFCFKQWSERKHCCLNFLQCRPKKFIDWKLSEKSDLLHYFPIDKIETNYIREVNGYIFSIVHPTPLVKPRLAAISDTTLASILDIIPDDSLFGDQNFLNFVSGNKIRENSIPFAHRYGGHQFGEWAGQLGDGRAHILGEYVSLNGEKSELQLKGSGKTPYSRRGDGRAVIRSSVREFLCSEAMHALGVPTSRAVSLVVSEEPVIRDQFYNGNIKTEKGAVVLRTAPSWFRIGSLEILTFHNEIANLKLVVDSLIINFFSEEVVKYKKFQNTYNINYLNMNTHISTLNPDKYLLFFETVQNLTIGMIVDWMSYGFAHGVCNTDNFSLLGITIDYGPFGFVDAYDPNFIPNTSDDLGRYSLGNQASVGMENMDRLLNALLPLLTNEQKNIAQDILQSFGTVYHSLLIKRFKQKLGLITDHKDNERLVASLLLMMETTKSDFTMTFHELSLLTNLQLQDASKIPISMWSLKKLMKHNLFSKWLSKYNNRLLENPRSFNKTESMLSYNPRYILRNWIAESAIKEAEQGSFKKINQLLQILKNPFTKQEIAEKLKFAKPPPKWAKSLKVSCSS